MKLHSLLESAFQPLILACNGTFAFDVDQCVAITNVPSTITNEQLATLFQKSFDHVHITHYNDILWGFGIEHGEFHMWKGGQPHIAMTWQQFVDTNNQLKSEDDFED